MIEVEKETIFMLIWRNLFLLPLSCILAVLFLFCQPLYASDARVAKVRYIIDSFDNDEIVSEIPISQLENVLQDADSVYFGKVGECTCDCAGGDILFSFFNDKKTKFFASAKMDKICSLIGEDLVLIWKLKNSDKLKNIIDLLTRKNGAK